VRDSESLDWDIIDEYPTDGHFTSYKIKILSSKDRSMDIRLDDPSFIPISLKRELEQHWMILQSSEYMEELTRDGVFRNIAMQLELFIQQNRVLGYHCTKEPISGHFLSTGLRTLDRVAHQTQFLETHGHLFSQHEKNVMRSAWESYFPGAQDIGRNGLLWFCLSAYLVVNNGTKYFFNYFGGEAIYMPLLNHPLILEKLRKIGSPVVVEVRLNPNELKTLGEFPFALNALSHYQKSVNPSAYIHSREGHLKRNVTPEEITQIIPKDKFF